MTVNTQYSLSPSHIGASNEVRAFEFGESGKVVASPIDIRRLIYAESILTQEANARLILETDSRQSWLVDFFLVSSTPSYRIDILQQASGISSISSNYATGHRVLYNLTLAVTSYQGIIVPPDCKMYVVAFNQITQMFASARRFYSSGIEPVK